MAFTKPQKKKLGQCLQKRGVVGPGPSFFLYVLTFAGRFVGSGEDDQLILFSSFFFSETMHRATPPSKVEDDR